MNSGLNIEQINILDNDTLKYKLFPETSFSVTLYLTTNLLT